MGNSLKIGISAPITTLLFLTEMDLPVEKMPGGLQSATVSNLINGLWCLGHELVVYTLDKDIAKSIVFTGKRITVCYAQYRKRFRIFDFFKKERQGLVELMRKYPVDILHAHWSYEFALAALHVDRNSIVTLHDWAPAILKLMPNYYRLGRFFMHLVVMKRTRYLLTNSEYMRKNMKNVESKILGVIPNPFEIPNSPKAAKAQGTIIAVNNGFNGLKNVQTLLRAFPAIYDQLKKCQLFLYGYGYEVGGDAQKWAESNHIPLVNVNFCGAVSYEAVLEKIGSAEILVHPSKEESFGNILVEAMMRSTAVIGGNASGAVPFVLDHGNAGILVDIRSPTEIANAVCKLFSDLKKLAQVQSAGYSFAVKTFTPGIIAAQHISIYEQLLKEKTR